MITNNRQRIVDLTHPIHEGMTTFPVAWHPYVEVSLLARHGIEERETRKLVLGTHSGTHMDAPRHFVRNGATVDHVPLTTLVGPTQVVDWTDLDELTQIEPDDLEQRINKDSCERLLMRYDWCRWWGDKKFYESHPFISEESAHWMNEHGVKLVGMDAPQLDNPMHGRGSGNDSPIHKILLGADVVFVECLRNLKQIRQPTCTLVVLPLNVIDGDGAPARCIAIEE